MSVSPVVSFRVLPAAPLRNGAPRSAFAAGARRRIEPEPRPSPVDHRRTASRAQPSSPKEGFLTSLRRRISTSVAAAFGALILCGALALLSLIPDGFDGTALVVEIVASGYLLAGFVALEALRLLRAIARGCRLVQNPDAAVLFRGRLCR
jgi:hypothetical protein